MTDEDGLDRIDSVHADHLGIDDHRQSTGVHARALPKRSPKSSRDSRVGRTQDEENAAAAPEGIDSRRACGRTIAADDEIHGSSHRVDPVAAGPPTTTGPLSVRRNASSWRSSAGFSRNGRNSLWPVAAAGA